MNPNTIVTASTASHTNSATKSSAGESEQSQTRHANIYETITQRILSQLEAGQVPWHKTWISGLPKSMTTGKEYRGINILLLGSSHYRSRYWVTFREALRLGGFVRKGEKATPVIYWKWRTPEDIQKLREKTGRESFAPCVPFVNAVFNLDQVEEVPRPADDVPLLAHLPLTMAERVFETMPDKPKIEHSADHQPAYIPSSDRVLLPHLSQFETAAEYYAALFHELVHSTGHARRLDRFAEEQGNRIEKYSQEELVAEFGAAFLCGFAGIVNPDTSALQAGYIQGWMKALQNDNRLLIRAASAAQRATDYIRGKVSGEELSRQSASDSLVVNN